MLCKYAKFLRVFLRVYKSSCVRIEIYNQNVEILWYLSIPFTIVEKDFALFVKSSILRPNLLNKKNLLITLKQKKMLNKRVV